MPQTQRRYLVWCLATIVTAGSLAACAAQRAPVPPDLQPQPGPNCVAICTQQYKECAYGSQCMMVAACDMNVCIPQQQNCEAHCAGRQR